MRLLIGGFALWLLFLAAWMNGCIAEGAARKAPPLGAEPFAVWFQESDGGWTKWLADGGSR